MWWEPFLLDLSRGFFISGIFLFVINTIFGALQGFGHDQDVSGDHDYSLDHDIDADYDLTMDHDVSIDQDMDQTSVYSESSETSTPLMLLASTFMLSFGFFGTSLFSIDLDSYFRLAAILMAPVLVTMIVANFWQRIAKTELGNIVDRPKLIGRIGIVVHQLSYRGGSIRVEIGPPFGVVQLPAKTLKPMDEFLKGDRIAIAEFDGNICVCVEAQPMFG